jgi:D-serine dehydratase
MTGLDKGVPGSARSANVSSAGWNIVREDIPLPVCVLLETSVERNVTQLQRFTDESGVLLAPHGKTSMSPELFERQLAHGCFGLTVATSHQLRVARRHGISRVLYANQLVGQAEIGYVCDELRRDPAFDFYCLVDSVAGVDLLAERVAATDPGRPVQVLIEGGFPGGRCGTRSLSEAVDIARAVRVRSPHLTMVGVEGFEGLLQYRAPDRREADVREFLRFLVSIAEEVDRFDLFDVQDVVLSAGGSAFYDVVVEEFAEASLKRTTQVVLRSGCYLTHDSGIYGTLLEDINRRTSAPLAFEPALEVWAQVLSTPEPGLVIVSAGRRDFGQDAGNPAVLKHARHGIVQAPSGAWRVAGVSDQHAHIEAPEGHGIAVGDLIALGPSHPCTTFDKWRVIHMVDDNYTVVNTVRTWF